MKHKVACCNDRYVWCTCGERFHYDDEDIIDHIEEENQPKTIELSVKDYIEMIIEDNNINIFRFALDTNIDVDRLREIMRGISKITLEEAKIIERVYNFSANSMMNISKGD